MSQCIDSGNDCVCIVHVLGVYLHIGYFVNPLNPFSSLKIDGEINQCCFVVDSGEVYFLQVLSLFLEQKIVKVCSFLQLGITHERPHQRNQKPLLDELGLDFLRKRVLRKLLVVFNHSLDSLSDQGEHGLKDSNI